MRNYDFFRRRHKAVHPPFPHLDSATHPDWAGVVILSLIAAAWIEVAFAGLPAIPPVFLLVAQALVINRVAGMSYLFWRSVAVTKA